MNRAALEGEARRLKALLRELDLKLEAAFDADDASAVRVTAWEMEIAAGRWAEVCRLIDEARGQ